MAQEAEAKGPADGGAGAPRVAVLFWFYKAFDVCAARVAHLRRLNPGLQVFGLYGGPLKEADAARRALGAALDDLYVYPGPQDSNWKWIHGDQVIADWHDQRGRALAWDSLMIVQWDLLMLAPLSEVLAGLRAGEAVFPGDRPLAEVEAWWGWGGGGGEVQAREMADFRALLRSQFGYDGPLWCCLFLLAVLPRAFLDAYVAAGPPGPGFREDKLATLARVFETPVRAMAQLRPWWRSDPATRDASPGERALNTTREAVAPEVIAAELAAPGGRRVFHPVFEVSPFEREAAGVAPRGIFGAPLGYLRAGIPLDAPPRAAGDADG